MPNWATGTIKIRGTKENILRFCKEKLSERVAPHGVIGHDNHVHWAASPVNDEEIVATVYDDPCMTIWFEDSNRNFVEMSCGVPYDWDMEADGDEYTTTFQLWKINGDSDWCIVFPFIAAWHVYRQYYADLSKEYDLIFRIFTVEQGWGFFAEFQAENGEITVLAEGPSADEPKGRYGRFIWECPFPFLGG